ncbi:hypothetical protein Tco_1144546 [Tanacetum coccineum]
MADYKFHVDSKRGARMVPFVSKDRVPETWTEASNKVHVSVSNAQYAKFVVAEPCKCLEPTEKFTEDKLVDVNIKYMVKVSEKARIMKYKRRVQESLQILTTYRAYHSKSIRRNMEMEPDIENMTMSEYLEYEAEKERRLWDDVRSRRSPTNYYEAGVDSFHRNKSKTFSYPYSHNLTPPHHCFLPVQPYPKNYSVSTNESNDVDIENMTITEYNLYVAKQGLGMSPLRAENIKRMGHDIVQDSIWEQDDDSEEDQEEDDEIVQPLIPKPVHTTPPNDDYVAPTTKSIFDKLLEEFDDEILNVATIDEEADPTKDLEELERLLAMRPQSNFMEIQVDRDITSPGRLKHAKLILGYIDACEIQIRLIPIVGGGDDDGMIAPRMDLEHGLEHAISSSY